MRRRQGGFIDPLSLISLGFLIVSLLVGTVVINKQNANYDIRNKAATCMDPCQFNSDCGSDEYCYRPATGCPICKPKPTSTPTSAPTAAPTCNGTCVPGVSCVDEGMCGATGSCSSNQHCCRTCPTPTSTPTCGGLYDPCCGAYPLGSCNGGLYCSNLDGGTCLVKPTPIPVSCGRCSNTNACRYATWTNTSGANCNTVEGTVTYTINDSCGLCPSGQHCSGGICVNGSTSTSTPVPSGGICCPKNNTAGAINTCTGIPSSASCNNQSVCEWKNNIVNFSSCPALIPTPVPAGLCCSKNPNDQSPGTINTCTGINNPASCNYQSVCQWKLTCSGPVPTPTTTPLPSCGKLYEPCCGSGSCNSGLYCSNIDGGTCMTKVCTSGQKQCSGNVLQTCKVDGSGWNNSTCAYGCANNTCNPKPSSSPSPLPTPTPTRTPFPTPTPPCSNAGVSGICSSLNCCPGLTKVIGMYGSCQCKVAPTSSPTPIPRCSNFGSCVPVNNICERSYRQLDCRDSQKCGVHCSAPVTPSPTSTPQCSNLCKADPCCKCTTCDGNTALECSAVCNIQLPSPVPTSTNILQPSSAPTLTPTPSPSSPLGLCEVTEQCPGGYTCLNSYCVNNEEIEQCATDATVLANAAVGSNGITLDASYVPPGLVDMETAVPNAMYASYDEVLIQEDAASDINCLVDGLAQNGYIPVFSYGYRSFELQDQLHEAYGNQAATAGNSQHQTGLAFDIHQYATVDENGNAQFFDACTLANTPECEPTRLAISIAAECGIAHPLGWDAPHFFDVTAACPGLDTFVESVQNPTATYYDELNAMVAQIQQECLEGL